MKTAMMGNARPFSNLDLAYPDCHGLPCASCRELKKGGKSMNVLYMPSVKLMCM